MRFWLPSETTTNCSAYLLLAFCSSCSFVDYIWFVVLLAMIDRERNGIYPIYHELVGLDRVMVNPPENASERLLSANDRSDGEQLHGALVVTDPFFVRKNANGMVIVSKLSIKRAAGGFGILPRVKVVSKQSRSTNFHAELLVCLLRLILSFPTPPLHQKDSKYVSL